MRILAAEFRRVLVIPESRAERLLTPQSGYLRTGSQWPPTGPVSRVRASVSASRRIPVVFDPKGYIRRHGLFVVVRFSASFRMTMRRGSSKTSGTAISVVAELAITSELNDK